MERKNLLGLVGLLVGTAYANELGFEEKTGPLYVNTQLAHYSIEKSREEGERDLVELVKVIGVEESWVYVETGTWYEIGVDQTNSKVRQDPLVLDELIEIPIEQKYSFYHIHPKRETNPWLMNFPSDDDLGFCVMTGLFDPSGESSSNFESYVVTEHLIYKIECLKRVPLREIFTPGRIAKAFVMERGQGLQLSLEPEALYEEAEEYVKRVNGGNSALKLSVRKIN